jgi:hypothetical protein
VEHWRGRRWWRMHELQPPGAVYQHQGQGAVRSERAQQASASISGLTASARGAQKAKMKREKADSRASGQGREGGGSLGPLQPSRQHAGGVVGVSACRASLHALPPRTDVH